MTYPTVNNVVTDARGNPVPNATVVISLVGAPAFSTDVQGEIINSAAVYTDATGAWSTTLKPNALITPSGTYYLVQEPGGASWTIVVPNDTATHTLQSLLVVGPNPPAGLPGVVRYDQAQALSSGQKTQAQTNMGVDPTSLEALLDPRYLNQDDADIDTDVVELLNNSGSATATKLASQFAPFGETARAQGAESTNATAISNETARATAAEATKANDAAVVHLAGAETISGAKAFTAPPTVPTQSPLDNSTKAASTAYADAAVAVEKSRAQTFEASLPATYGAVLRPEQYGAKGDGRTVTDAVSNGTTALSSASAAFTIADEGKRFVVYKSGTPADPVTYGTIAAFGSSTSITTSVTIPYSATGLTLVIATDDTTALQTCATAALAKGGARMELGAKTYGLTSELQLAALNAAVTLTGEGQNPGGSCIIAMHPNARVSYGEPPTGSGTTGETNYGRPGLIRDWRFDGNLLATRGPFFAPLIAYYTVANVWSTKCNGDGFVQCSQNATMLACNSDGHSGNGYTIDYGAQTITLLDCYSASNDGWDVQVRQSGGPGWGASSQPQDILFQGGILGEQGGSSYFANTGLGGIHIREGVDITINRVELPQTVGTGSVVLTPSTTNGYVGRVTMRDSRFSKVYINSNNGGAATSMGGSNEPITFEGWNVTVGAGIVNNSTAYIVNRGHDVAYAAQGAGAPPNISRKTWVTASDPTEMPIVAFGTGAQSNPLIIGQASASQTASIFEGRSSGGSVLAKLDVNGYFTATAGASSVQIGNAAIVFAGDTTLTRYGPHFAGITGSFAGIASVATEVPIISQGTSGQSSSLFEARNNSGTPLAKVDSAGNMVSGIGSGGQVTIGGNGVQFGTATDCRIYRANPASLVNVGQWTCIPNAASQVPLSSWSFSGQTADLLDLCNSGGTPIWGVTAAGIPRWHSASNQQTTVGAAGGASAPPATPTKYLKVVDSAGTTYVIPAYAAA